MDQSTEQPNKMSRRKFLQGAISLGVALGLGIKTGSESLAQPEIPNATPLPSQSESPLTNPEIAPENSINIYRI
jgi:hypothetical protein